MNISALISDHSNYFSLNNYVYMQSVHLNLNLMKSSTHLFFLTSLDLNVFFFYFSPSLLNHTYINLLILGILEDGHSLFTTNTITFTF
mmetsp:Transcript_18035/g.23034  ORF Transcript_18035/g.23034 Transcript_18035/m.23034 type:complete len:88 (-) Transcript_18035:199-462(-)